MDEQTNWHERASWYQHVQQTLKQAIQEVYEGRWKYTLSGDRALSLEIGGDSEHCILLKIVHDEETEELHFYLQVRDDITEVWQIQEIVHHMVADAAESLFLMLPLHTKDALQFWFVTGRYEHGHIGRFIFRKEDNPHIKFETELTLL